MKKIVINDTNIFIDLLSVQGCEVFFSLPWEVHTTRLVMEELTHTNQRAVIDSFASRGKLIIDCFTSDDYQELHEQYAEISNLSLADCSIWYLAHKTHYSLLTGDKNLRREAEKDGIEVHGIVYVIQAMVDELLLTPSEAINVLQQLQRKNHRLPKDDIESYLRRWKSLIEM